MRLVKVTGYLEWLGFHKCQDLLSNEPVLIDFNHTDPMALLDKTLRVTTKPFVYAALSFAQSETSNDD